MNNYVVWAILLIVQNAAFTFVSRARNSSSYGYHGVALICSNGIYFAQVFFLFDAMGRIRNSSSIFEGVALGTFYCFFSLIGGLSWHWLSINYIEKGKRKIS